MTDTLINASNMRKLALNNNHSSFEKDINSILEIIQNVASTGKFCYQTNDFLPSDIKEQLTQLGFSIRVNQNKSGHGLLFVHMISW